MAQLHKKFSNQGHEEWAQVTTNSYSRHGLGRAGQKARRYYRRLGKRAERRLILKEQG